MQFINLKPIKSTCQYEGCEEWWYQGQGRGRSRKYCLDHQNIVMEKQRADALKILRHKRKRELAKYAKDYPIHEL